MAPMSFIVTLCWKVLILTAKVQKKAFVRQYIT